MGIILRSVLAMVAGIIVAVVLISVVEFVNHLIYPLPPGLDPNNMAAMKAAIARLPAGAFCLVLVGWAVGTCAGSWVAARFAPRRRIAHGLLIGILLLMVAVANMLMLPHPLWVWIVGVGLFLPVAFAGASAGSRLPPPKNPAISN